jgi:hypothetical protein
MRRMLAPITALGSWLRSLRKHQGRCVGHRLKFSRCRRQGSNGLTALSPAAGHQPRLLAACRLSGDPASTSVADKVEAQFFGELLQLRMDPVADRATGRVNSWTWRWVMAPVLQFGSFAEAFDDLAGSIDLVRRPSRRVRRQSL